MKQDVADARQRLVSIIEERQLSEEASQNTTAEAISTNEELLSLNEELETAKEELQSTNEGAHHYKPRAAGEQRSAYRSTRLRHVDYCNFSNASAGTRCGTSDYYC